MVQNTSSQDVKRKVYHFYCKGRAANQLQEDINHTVVQYEDQLLAQQSCKDGVCTSTVLTVDQQRTVLYQAGQYQSRQPLVYTPYGQPSQHPGWLGFNGERPDPMTLHYLLGNGRRGFNPVLMRFNSPDSMSPFGPGGLNFYSYCRQDPVNYQDPSGNSRIGRFFLNLFGSGAGSRRHEVPKKIPVRQKKGAGTIFKNVGPYKDKVTFIVTTGRTETEGYDFLGYHGSSEWHQQSLEAGLDIKHSISDAFGPGFYYSPNIETAISFALGKDENHGYVYGVYGISSKLKGHIKHYVGGDYRVIHEKGFGYVLVKAFIQYSVGQVDLAVRR